MTCIVGLQTEAGVWIGGDSVGVAGYRAQPRADPKVFINGDLLVGYTGSFRMGQLLRFRLDAPKHHQGIDDYEWLATEFIDTVRQCFTDFGWQGKEENRDEGGTFLIGYNGKLYSVDADYQVGIPALGYTACGAGDEIALGALYASDPTITAAAGKETPTPEARVALALRAAVAFSTVVREPFTILHQEVPT